MFIDTSFIVELLRESSSGKRGPATAKLESIRHLKLLMPVFVLCELRAGAERSREPEKEQAAIQRLAEYLQVVYPEPGFAGQYAEIASHLRKAGSPIPLMDLLIATLVRCNGVPLLTRDVEHFSRVPGILVESF